MKPNPIYSIYMYKEDLALNNQQWLISHQTKLNFDFIFSGWHMYLFCVHVGPIFRSALFPVQETCLLSNFSAGVFICTLSSFNLHLTSWSLHTFSLMSLLWATTRVTIPSINLGKSIIFLSMNHSNEWVYWNIVQ